MHLTLFQSTIHLHISIIISLSVHTQDLVLRISILRLNLLTSSLQHQLSPNESPLLCQNLFFILFVFLQKSKSGENILIGFRISKKVHSCSHTGQPACWLPRWSCHGRPSPWGGWQYLCCLEIWIISILVTDPMQKKLPISWGTGEARPKRQSKTLTPSKSKALLLTY